MASQICMYTSFFKRQRQYDTFKREKLSIERYCHNKWRARLCPHTWRSYLRTFTTWINEWMSRGKCRVVETSDNNDKMWAEHWMRKSNKLNAEFGDTFSFPFVWKCQVYAYGSYRRRATKYRNTWNCMQHVKNKLLAHPRCKNLWHSPVT